MRRGILFFTALVCSLAMTSCSNDPTPSADSQHNYGNTHFAVSKAGDPFEVDGCLVSVHRVTTASSDLLPDFTLATAKCPTATVDVANNVCGKSCVSNNVLVTPNPTVFDTQNTQADEATRAEAAANTPDILLAQRHVAERQATQQKTARIQQLRAQVLQLSTQIVELEQGSK
jgi:hypothetical protein